MRPLRGTPGDTPGDTGGGGLADCLVVCFGDNSGRIEMIWKPEIISGGCRRPPLMISGGRLEAAPPKMISI